MSFIVVDLKADIVSPKPSWTSEAHFRPDEIGTSARRRRRTIYSVITYFSNSILPRYAFSWNVHNTADSLRIQTRIRNQGDTLLTALLIPNVPLTNNLAEQKIRPMVITRKISGGSRSDEGAMTHAVNMSVFQTIKMRNQPIISTLRNYILKGISGRTE